MCCEAIGKTHTAILYKHILTSVDAHILWSARTRALQIHYGDIEYQDFWSEFHDTTKDFDGERVLDMVTVVNEVMIGCLGLQLGSHNGQGLPGAANENDASLVRLPEISSRKQERVSLEAGSPWGQDKPPAPTQLPPHSTLAVEAASLPRLRISLLLQNSAPTIKGMSRHAIRPEASSPPRPRGSTRPSFLSSPRTAMRYSRSMP